MRRAAAIALLTLAACANTALPVMNGRITTEDEFMATAAGRTISNDLATISITRNGRIRGISDGVEIAGRWRWEDGFWCRTITEPVQTPEDCQVWEITNRTLIITRDKGRGERIVYPLPAPQAIAYS